MPSCGASSGNSDTNGPKTPRARSQQAPAASEPPIPPPRADRAANTPPQGGGGEGRKDTFGGAMRGDGGGRGAPRQKRPWRGPPPRKREPHRDAPPSHRGPPL